MIRRKKLHYSIRKNHKWEYLILLWLFFVGSISSTYSQTGPDKVPLVDVLSNLENQFQYTFTFADDTVKNIVVFPLEKDILFDQILENLQEQTGLIFSRLPNNFISINKKTEESVICGVVKDPDTGFPLEGATIRGNNEAVITNVDGKFELQVSDKNEKVIIGYLGFETKVFYVTDFDTADCKVLYLEPKTEALGAVLLSNYITKGIGKNEDGSFLIDYENFGILPGLIETDVLQTIQALPGIVSADETVSNINIRGGTHDQNLILWDGIKMYQSGHFFGLITAVNPYMTKKATLIKNGTNPEYTDGVSGTLLMHTDTAVNDSLEASVGINMINADIFVDVPIGKKSSIQIASRKSIRDITETPTYNQYADRVSQDSELESVQQQVLDAEIDFDFYDASVRWNYDISNKDNLRVNFLTINNELTFTESAFINNIIQSRESSLEQNSLGVGFWYQRDWNNTSRSVLQVYNSDYKLRASNANLEEEQQFIQENKVSETGVKVKTLHTVNHQFSLQYGYQFIETGVTNLNDIDNPLLFRKEERVIRTHSLFSNLTFQTNEKNNILNLGLRYTYNEKFKSHFIEPRLTYNQQITKELALEVLGELKHQNTSQIINFQNDFLGVEKRRWILANDEDIPVVKGGQVSLGLQYSPKSWLITAEGYYKKINDITARSQGFRTKYEFQRAIGDYQVAGIDFLINKRFTNISAWLSYSLANNDYSSFEEFEDPEFPNNIDITHVITLGGSYVLNNYKVSAGLNWNSGLPTTQPRSIQPANSTTIEYGVANSTRLKEYFRLDVSAIYDFRIGKGVKGQTGISVWNLTNRENIIGNYYRRDPDSEPMEMTEVSLGITPNASFRVSF